MISLGPGAAAGKTSDWAIASWPDGPARALVAVVLLLTLVRILVAGNTGLTDDEAYYRLWALAPAMSYLDHPPMVGWMMAAGRWVAGDNWLGLRFGALVASLVGPLVLWRTAYILLGERAALRAVWIALAMPLLAVGGVVMTPDTPSVLFWGLSAWAIAELHASRNANWWLTIGVFAGLGLLSKYTNLFVGASILLWLLLISANRHWFRTWQLWAGGLIACLLALPVVMWNAKHNWASFSKQFGRVAQGKEFAFTYAAEMVGAFAGLASPLTAGLAMIGLWIVVRSAMRTRHSVHALIAVFTLPLLVYFMVHALHGRVQPNWLAPIYPSLAVCAAIALGRMKNLDGGLFGRVGLGALFAGFAISALVYLRALSVVPFPTIAKDPADQMRGWPELAADVARLQGETGSCWIATSSYATTGQLKYAFKDVAPVWQVDERQRYSHLPAPSPELLTCPALYVDLERRVTGAALEQYFSSVAFLTILTRRHRDRPIATYAVYAVSSPRDDFLRSLGAGSR